MQGSLLITRYAMLTPVAAAVVIAACLALSQFAPARAKLHSSLDIGRSMEPSRPVPLDVWILSGCEELLLGVHGANKR